jgi:hypothetical protein
MGDQEEHESESRQRRDPMWVADGIERLREEIEQRDGDDDPS